MSEKRHGPGDKLEIRNYQIQIVNEILTSFNNKLISKIFKPA